MGKFSKKRGASSPKISTEALPDIIFMLLFFFMVTTVMRDTSKKVTVITPSATELTKLEQKSLVHYIYVGRPTDQFKTSHGTSPKIQLGDKFATDKDIALFVRQEIEKLPERQKVAAITSLKVDGGVTMGIVSDIKLALRKIGQLKVNYSAKKRVD